ncbi:glycosyl transferase [Dysgonomonas sp. 216]|uniref:glycogen/starch synthase n=1 Tax=Dysgonomonas sp. 216 TaxID=2302934 RepID=UPI0013CFB750|nr:glycogen/starch synthase [Dysgonomonas sp. 216]NDW18145.1 glycosyl transferase [Dysgonomonas sp. 216]
MADKTTINNDNMTPDYVFETSWEVCNKVGGIYTVLSSKAKTMLEVYNGNVMFIGPDVWKDSESLWFIEDKKLLTKWKKHAIAIDGLKIRVGYWDVPGRPIAVLVDFQQFFPHKDEIYADMWGQFGVDSLHAYGDYDESCMFAYATGRVIESYYKYHKLSDKNVIAHFNEWMLGMGALYIKDKLPQIATVFTTHATSIGRSIAGNNKPLYNYLSAYNGDQMARELNMEAKHSVEKRTALEVDCFTTVSEITARECKQLLERDPEVTPNGFEKDFVPTGREYTSKRNLARKKMIDVAEKLLGKSIDTDALLIATSGRYEYKNKGIDVFIDAMNRLNHIKQLNKDVVAFVMVPAWVDKARPELKQRIQGKKMVDTPLDMPYITHWLHNMEHDMVLNQIRFLGLDHVATNKVNVIFVPSYLNGTDGIFNMTYYDLLIGLDATVFPSYYEPWGYTPHESIAFSVPSITTSLSGFGMWVLSMGDERGMHDGGEVIRRDDYNFIEVSEEICNMIFEMATRSNEQIKSIKKKAAKRASLADWKHFFHYYEEAYSKALVSARTRMDNNK